MLQKYMFNSGKTQNSLDGFLGRSIYTFLAPPIDTWPSEDGLKRYDRSFIPVDLEATDDKLCIKADLPGIGPDNISIEVDEDVLTIEITIENDGDVQLENRLIQERRGESTRRRITLPYPIEREKVTSTYKYGVLSIDLPRVKKTAARKIPIS